MLKIIYAGTPEFAVPALQALLGSDHETVAVYTQPDRPAGRGRQLQQSPVKACALAGDIPVFQPESFKQNEEIQKLKALRADLMVVAAYGLILPLEVLEAPRLGCINIHASLLPRWRGAAPIQRAILAGDSETGITIMQMDEGLDTGDMLAKQAIGIEANWTSGDLHNALCRIGAKLLMSTLDKLETGLTVRKQDDSTACYAPKLVKSEAAIDWQKDATTLHREIRAFVPWPVSFTRLDEGMLRIWKAEVVEIPTTETPGQVIEHDKTGIYVACGSGVLRIDELQFAGKNRTDAAQVLNARDLSGKCFSPT